MPMKLLFIYTGGIEKPQIFSALGGRPPAAVNPGGKKKKKKTASLFHLEHPALADRNLLRRPRSARARLTDLAPRN